jgi:tetratricopeptide (TPR) repeat protein
MDQRHPLHWTARDQTWNYQCAECHSTNLQKNYDPANDSYGTSWDEIDVACEACHGPGSGHLAWAQGREPGQPVAAKDDLGLVLDLAEDPGAGWILDPDSGKPSRSKPRRDQTQVELCARCHARRGQAWEPYEYGQPLHQSHRLALLEDDLYYPDGQIKDEVYVYGSFIQSRMYQAGVVCSDCHEPHSLALRAEGGQVCARCHLPDRYAAESHHHHPPDSTGADCIACHMPQRAYMVIDERADHSLRVPRPDLTLSLGSPNACNQCHKEQDAAWAQAAMERWYGSQASAPHFGQALHAARENASDAASRLLALAGDPAQPAIARATAVERLAERADSGQLLTIQRLLADPDALVRAAAVAYLDGTDLRTRVELGWPLLEDPSRRVRLEAARVLAPLMRQGLPPAYREQLQTALGEYVRSQQVNADRAEAQLNLGLIQAVQGQGAPAEAAYRKAIALEPGFVPAYVNLADLYRQLGREAEGERLLRQGMELAPQAPSLPHALGLLLVREKRVDEALAPLARAAELAPDQPRYAYVQALALQGLERPEQALAVLASALERHPRDHDLLLAAATMSRDQGDSAAARAYAERLFHAHPNAADAQALWAELGPSAPEGK